MLTLLSISDCVGVELYTVALAPNRTVYESVNAPWHARNKSSGRQTPKLERHARTTMVSWCPTWESRIPTAHVSFAAPASLVRKMSKTIVADACLARVTGWAKGGNTMELQLTTCSSSLNVHQWLLPHGPCSNAQTHACSGVDSHPRHAVRDSSLWAVVVALKPYQVALLQWSYYFIHDAEEVCC